MEDDTVRRARHAGSWYSANDAELDKQLVSWLESSKFDIKNVRTLKAIIAPHAGYFFSGSTAAWSFKYMKYAPEEYFSLSNSQVILNRQEKPLRVFLLGPCHHVYIRGCGLSKLKTYSTPIGDIELDLETIEQLKSEGKWIVVDKEAEEEEHSLEMHLPYIKKMLADRPFKLVPVMVGSIDAGLEKHFGELFAKYFDDDNTVFCISSDFCHWGKNFRFTPYNKEHGEIYQSIERLDKMGMKLIEEHNTKGFSDYLDSTKNTICGRHPISLLLNIIANSKYKDQLMTKFVRYVQSDQIKDPNDSSVSYAAAVTFLYD